MKMKTEELMIIPDAVHTDLYDNANVIPFEKIAAFLKNICNKEQLDELDYMLHQIEKVNGGNE